MNTDVVVGARYKSLLVGMGYHSRVRRYQMRLIQTGTMGVFLVTPRLQVENVVVVVQRDDPDNPVAVGYNTILTVTGKTAWLLTGPNLNRSGVGTATVDIPVGEYEITLDPA